MADFYSVPPITRRWWAFGHMVLVPPIFWMKRMRVRGKEHVPATGPVLVVCNHVSQWDPPTLGLAARPRKSYYMAKLELFRIPAYNYVIWRLGAFPVERGGADRRALRLARDLLRRGDVLLMFPEGTRNPEGRLRPGLPGAGSLGLEPGSPSCPPRSGAARSGSARSGWSSARRSTSPTWPTGRAAAARRPRSSG